MKKQDTERHYLSSSLFLIGLVFLVESIVLAFVLSQAPIALLGSTISIAWIYTIIKFFAGLITIFTGLALSQKK
jgi:uncharacterized membrane protein